MDSLRWAWVLLLGWLAGPVSAQEVLAVDAGPLRQAGVVPGMLLSAWAKPAEPTPIAVRDPWDVYAVEYGLQYEQPLSLLFKTATGTRQLAIGSGSWFWLLAPAHAPADRAQFVDAEAAAGRGDAKAACALHTGLAERLLPTAPRAAAWSHWRCARAQTEVREINAARAAVQRASDLLDDDDLRVWLQYALVLHLRRAGVAGAALVQQLEQSTAAVGTRAPPVASRMLRLELARARWQMADLAVARTLLESLREETRSVAPRSLLMLLVTQSLAQVRRDQRDMPAAQVLFTEGAALAERLPPSLELAGFHMIHGLFQRMRGEFELAEGYLQQSLRMLREVDPVGRQIAAALHNLAPLLLDQGELNRAEQALNEAIAIQNRIDPSGHTSRTTLIARAALQLSRGEPEAALRDIDAAIVLVAQDPPPTRAAAHAQRGIILLQMARHADAELSLATADRLLKDSTPGSMIHSWVLQSLAEARQQLGRGEDARAALAAALQMREKLAPDGQDLAKGRHAMADLLLSEGDVEAAAIQLEAALPVLARTAPHSSFRAHALHSAGRIAAARGDAAASARLYCEAVAVMEAQKLRVSPSAEGRARYAADQRQLYEDCALSEVAGGRADAALAVIEGFRARGLLETLAGRAEVLEAALPAALQSRLTRTQRDLLRAEAQADASALALAQRDLDRVLDDVRRAAPRYAALRLPEAFDRTRVQALLRPDQAAVVYLLGVKQSMALVLRADGPPQPVHLDLSRDSARQLAAEIASAMESGAPREDWQAPLRHAHRALIDALQPHLRGARKLVLVPDLELYLLPFAALIDAQDRFLIQDYAISQAYSLSLLAQLETATSPAQEQLLAVADPASEGVAVPAAYRALQGPDLAPLPHARREVQAIASLFGDAAQQLSGAAVTETAVAAAASDADVLHLAVHGYFDPVHSARSGLVLAAGGAAESGDDGLLTVAEVAADWRLDAALVVLSACHTGRGELSAAEGLFGLTRAFQYAGARAVLSSLWAVPDRSTEVLMVEFHRQRQRGIGHAEALRLAQLQLLGRPAQGASRGVGGLGEPDRRNELAAPWHWAAFSVNGARGRLVQARP